MRVQLTNRSNPCYNKTTKQECPDRYLGCHSNCSKWADYVAKRDEVYQERYSHALASADVRLIDKHYGKPSAAYELKANIKRRK